MEAEELQKYLRERPFQPFRIFLSDGSHYDIRHPEMAMLTRRAMIVSLDRKNAIPNDFSMCTLSHIVRVEYLSPMAGKSRARAK
jgi:hypothetical protein